MSLIFLHSFLQCPIFATFNAKIVRPAIRKTCSNFFRFKTQQVMKHLRIGILCAAAFFWNKSFFLRIKKYLILILLQVETPAKF